MGGENTHQNHSMPIPHQVRKDGQCRIGWVGVWGSLGAVEASIIGRVNTYSASQHATSSSCKKGWSVCRIKWVGAWVGMGQSRCEGGANLWVVEQHGLGHSVSLRLCMWFGGGARDEWVGVGVWQYAWYGSGCSQHRQ
jgi:hypothetical protein